MDKMSIFIDKKNRNELLRIYEGCLEKATTDKEKEEYQADIAKQKAEIAKLEEAEKSL